MESVQISRCKLTSHAIVRGLETAETLAVKLGDGKLRIKVQKLRDCVVEAVTGVGRIAEEVRRREERELEELRREMERRMFEIESRREEGIRMAVQGRVGDLRAAVDQWAEGRPYGGRLPTTQRGGGRKDEEEADWDEESGEDGDEDDEDEDDEEDEDMEEEFYDLEDRMEDDELYEDQRDAMR